MHDKQVRRRRAVLGLLVAISLILLTAYFGESPSSPLHSVQRGIVEVISPIQAGASKVLSPVKDVAGWFSDTFQAKSQRDRLRKEVAQLTRQVDYYHQQAILAQQLEHQVGLDQSNAISSYHPVTANVIGKDPILWYQTIEVDKGSDDGVSVNDPVTGDGYLVGKVSTVDATVSIVTLLTDQSYAVTAEVLGGGGDTGVLVPAVGNPGQMLLQDLPSHATVQTSDQVVTAGYKDPSNPALDSLYPPGLPIGQVSNASQNELLNNQQVTVLPGASLRHLTAVQILTAPHAGTARAQVGTGTGMNPTVRLAIRLTGLALLTVIVQTAAVSQISIFGISADLSPLVVMSVGLLGGSMAGAIMGFGTGLLVDTVLVQTLGVTSLLYIAIGYWAGRLREARDPAHGLVPMAAGAVATAVAGLGMTLIQVLLGVDAPVSLLLLQQIFITILVNTLIALPVYAFVRRIVQPALPDDPRRRRRRAYTTGGLSPLQSPSQRLGQLPRR